MAGSSLLGAVGGNALDMTINNLKDRETRLGWNRKWIKQKCCFGFIGNAVAAGVAKVGGVRL